MLRILYLCKGGSIGGSQNQLIQLVRGLDASYEPAVVCTSEGETPRRFRAAGVPTEVVSLRPWRKWPQALLRYVDAERLCSLVRRYNPTLIHSSDMWLGNYVAWLGWRLRVPTVVHVRAPLGIWSVYKRRLSAATGLISISSRITRTLTRARIPADRIVQIEDAVHTETFRPREGVDALAPDGRRAQGVVTVGLVGRIEPAKRQLEFVLVAGRVAARLPGRVRFVLVGDARRADYLAHVKRCADSAGLDGQLVWAGRRDDMPDVLNSLDLLVSLSGGSVMYEAMSCGLCVLSAGFTRPQDSIHLRDGVNGVVLPTSEASALAEAMIYLIEHPEVRRRLGRAAREHAETHLSSTNLVAQTRAFYERLLTREAGGRRPRGSVQV